MESSNGTVPSYGARNGFRLSKTLIAVAIVFVMISSPFIAIASTESEPVIWSSKDQYVPGEVVVIYGEGWGPFVEMTLELDHPDFDETKTYTVTPDLYGRFAFDGYVCEPVAQWAEPVVVTATQYYGDEILTATTQFYDPAAYIQGYTIRPTPRWTQGDIKGYNEGDSVPFQVVLNKAQLKNPDFVEMEIGFDFVDYNPISPPKGIDFLTQYWDDPPSAPYNTYTNSSEPFYVDPAAGTITLQERQPNQIDEGFNQLIQVWKFRFVFAETAREAVIKFGAHMALTTSTQLGASYYTGSSLHVRIVSMIPSSDEGNRDVPIALGAVLQPPEMQLFKECEPQEVVEGDLITFTISWVNVGQADAQCVLLEDYMPPQIDFVPGSFQFWTSLNPAKMTPSPGPVVVGDYFSWYIGSWSGTGPPEDPDDPLWGYLSFQGIVNTNEPGVYWNHVYMSYSDDHGGVFPMLHAECPFWIISEPSLMIEKSGPDYAHVNDTITYTYYVTNTGLIDLVVDVVDDVAGTVATGVFIAAGDTVMLTMEYEIETRYPDPIYNIVTATGEDAYGRTVTATDDWCVDILEPMIDVEKDVDLTCEKPGEEVVYTIVVMNPSLDTDLYNVVVSDPMLGLYWTGTLLAGQYEDWVIPFIVTDAYGDPMVNTVTATGEDLLCLSVTDSDSATVDVVHPAIMLTKVADEGCAAVGETMTYTLTVTNPASSDVWLNGTLVDEWNGQSWDFYNLMPGQTFVRTLTIVVPNMDPFVNWAHVDAWDHQRHHVYDEASATIDVYHPMIAVDKWADVGHCAAVGDTIIYTIVVYNPSHDTRMYFEVEDIALSWSESGWLEPEENRWFYLEYVVTEQTPDPFVNVVYVWAHDEQWDPESEFAYLHEAEDRASWEIDILHAMIDVDKWADVGHCAAVGDTIVYTIVVTNPSDDTTVTFYVSDVMLSWSASGVLGPLQSITYTVTYVVAAGDPDPLINEVYVWAHDEQYDPESPDARNHIDEDWATWEIDILHAMIDVEKWADVGHCAAVGDTVIYTIVVSNPSDDTWMNYEVWDITLGWGASGYLAPLGSDTYYIPYLVTEQTPDPFLNLVEVWGYDDQYRTSEDWENHEAWDWDEWEIDILHAAIELDKWADVGHCAAVGDTIVYTITVHNPSIDTWMNYYVQDITLGWSASGYLAPGATDTYTITYVVDGLTPDPFLNEAYVWAYDDQWETSPDPWNHEVEDWARWDIDILHAAIDVEKWADVGRCAAVGDTIVYTIVVSNPSDDTWMNYEVWDYALGWGASGYLAPLGSDTHYVPYLVTEQTPDPFVNFVEVWGYDDQYRTSEDWENHEAWDWDEWTVDILHAMIVVDKWADVGHCAAAGDLITYTIVVSNPSIDTGVTYELFDYLLGGYWTGYLAPGASHTYTMYYEVTEGTPDPLVNEVFVIAYDDQYWESQEPWNHVATDDASWEIDILHPEIGLDKYATTDIAHAGDTIVYYIDVWNPSDDTTMWAEVYDPMLGGLLFEGYIDPGVMVTLGPFYYVVPDEEPRVEWVCNMAYVDAWDYQDHYAYAEDRWCVEIIYPEIDVEKTGPEYASVGDIITYTVTVTNTGDTPLYDVVVYDSLVGIVATYAMLDVGESHTFTYTYEVPAGEGTVDNTVTASGYDILGWYVWDEDSWVVIKYSKVGGFKFADLDRNAVFDDDEPGLINWVIELYGVLDNGSLDIRTTATDTDGYYEFTKLTPGVYTVSEILQTGWVAYTATTYTFTVGSGTSFVRSFGNLPEGSICGYKWWDYDLDGVWDEDEDGIEGWTIYLYGMDVGGMIWDLSMLTDETGFYCFSGLPPGVYYVSEEMRLGWYATTPAMVEVDVSALEPFEERVCFGNAKYGSITGWKWLDEYMNGYRDGNEPYLEGWVIWIEGTLINGDHYGPYSTVTDENGMYAFEGLLPGEYTVWEELPPGWTHVTPWMYNVTIEEGSWVHCAKFGNVELGSINGWKFLDWDMDGLMDGNEPGIPGWEITLTGWLNDGDWPWSPVNATHIGPITILTDANGYWEFLGLLPGIYTVTEEDREGWYHVTPSSVTLWIASGTHVIDVKFGNVPYICFEVFKFEDLNGNGRWDEGEPGVPGWEIRIVGVQNDGVLVDILLVTDEWGYAFTCFRMLPGEYLIVELMQEGWMPTTQTSYEFAVPMCMEPSVYGFVFGNFKLGMIFGYKFEDMDGDGIKDPEDTPIEGWEIYLYPPWGGMGMTTTDENGYFEFIGLPYGWYVVEEEDVPGWIHTTPSAYEVLVTSGARIEIPVFLNFELGSIEGYKFEDLNSNGVWDDGEPAIERWPIYMVRDALPDVYVTYTNANGWYCFDGLEADYYVVYEDVPPDWTATTPTGYLVDIFSGDHIQLPDFGNFRNVLLTLFKYEDVWGDGEYNEPDVGIGWTITVEGPGVPGGSVTVLTDTNGYAYVWVTAAGTYTVTEADGAGWCHTTDPVVYVDVISGLAMPSARVEFGNFRCVDITVFKFEDVDSNGEYDPEVDDPIEGWEIFVYEYYSGEFDYLYTDMDGLAYMHLCKGGWWFLMESYVEGWTQTLPEDGGGYYVLVTSGSAVNTDTLEEQYYYEFGNFECVEILIFKYWDTCSNGWYDPQVGDVPLGGWYFALYMLVDDEWVFVDDGNTEEDGTLMFRVCQAGTYKVVEEDISGWSHITPLSGMYVFAVVSGDVVELLFGNYLDVYIPIFKYEDVDSNGEYDPEIDEPIEGWYFVLEHVSGAPVYSGYTDENGMLVLVVNRSGIYTLTEEDREGWTHVNPIDGVRLVNVFSGVQVPLQEFGNFKDVQIVVFKFDDIYADGQYCPGEGDVPIEGWLIELYLEVEPDVWVLVDSKLTGPDGYATFVVTMSGHYKLVEEARAGWWWIMPMSGEYDFWVYSSDVFCPFEFANFKLGMIYGYKWDDLNGNGEWDEGEPPLMGWTISFETLAGFYMFGTTDTDENGYYAFTGLPPGLYLVWEEVEGGWVPTSDPSVVVEIWGHREVRVDFFNFERGCIEGYKYEDMDGDGRYDPEVDEPIEGWMIYLSDPTGYLIAVTETDASGHYMFCGLGPGTYVVSEESRDGWIHTTPDSETVVMTSGALIVIHDFLNFELGCICGYKFEDSNSNGIWDEGEDPIEGWPIYMIRDALPDVYVTYTDSDGRFCFRNLRADYYVVYEIVPEGWVATTLTSHMVVITSGDREMVPDFGNFKCVKIPIFKYEDVNGNGVFDNGDVPIRGWEFTVSGPAFVDPLVVTTDEYGYANVTVCHAGEYTVTEEDRDGWMHVNPEDGYLTVYVESGDVIRPLRFGNFELGRIVVFKYYDWNMNGRWDEGEVPLSGWVIWANGTLVGGGEFNAARITDDSGTVSFDGLPAGTYVISERLIYGPPGWVPTTPSVIVIDITSGAVSRIEIGNVLLGSIWGHKFYDKDLDGVWDEDEPGLEGWRILLTGVDDMGDPVNLATVTDEDGYYIFDDLHPGVYEVDEVVPPTWEPTTVLPVVVDVSGAMEEFSVQVNIGNIQYAIIWGYKFLDTYEDAYPFWPNGLFDEDEYGLGIWEITLQGRDINGNLVSMVQYTDNEEDVGYYAFTNLLPGTYWVNETLMWGYYATRPIANLVMVYPFPLGPVIIRIDFGNLLPSVDPELNFVLHEGWNLWSSPLQVHGGLTAKGLLAAIGPTGVMVTKLDTATQKWVSYVVGDPDKFDFPVELGMGYYVWSSSFTVFKLKGDLVLDSSTPLAAGWNIMGYNALEPIMASEALDMVSGTTAWMITYLDAETGKYVSYVRGDPAKFDFVVTPGRAYFIWIEGSGTVVY